MNTIKYRVTGGVVMDACEWLRKENEAVNDRIEHVCKEHGAEYAMHSGRGIECLVFKDGAKIPDGWKSQDHFLLSEKKKVTGWAPSRRSKAGREILAEWAGVKKPTAIQFQDRIPGCGTLAFAVAREHGYGMRILYMHPEKIGNTIILHVPDVPTHSEDATSIEELEPTAPRWTPPDGCVRMKESEYHLLREAQGEKK